MSVQQTNAGVSTLTVRQAHDHVGHAALRAGPLGAVGLELEASAGGM